MVFLKPNKIEIKSIRFKEVTMTIKILQQTVKMELYFRLNVSQDTVVNFALLVSLEHLSLTILMEFACPVSTSLQMPLTLRLHKEPLNVPTSATYTVMPLRIQNA